MGPWKQTVLHVAAEGGHGGGECLAAGADKDKARDDGATPLCAAARGL